MSPDNYEILNAETITTQPVQVAANTNATKPAFAAAQRRRRKVESLFAELKNQIGLRGCVLSHGYGPELETTGSLPKIEISRISHGSHLR